MICFLLSSIRYSCVCRVEKQRHDLTRDSSKLDWLAGARLGHAIDLGVFERIARIVLDLAGDNRPAPRGVDFVQQRTGRIFQEIRARALRLQLVKSDAAPALQRIVMPGAAGQIRVEKVITVGHDIEAGALLIRNNCGEGVRELLAVDRVEHGCVERASPQALRIPRRSRPGAGRGGG